MTESEEKSIPRWRCHKEVEAFKIADVVYSAEGGVLCPEDKDIRPVEVDMQYMAKHSPQEGGYYVRYKDGYESFSPAEAFEDGYTLID